MLYKREVFSRESEKEASVPGHGREEVWWGKRGWGPEGGANVWSYLATSIRVESGSGHFARDEFSLAHRHVREGKR